MLFKNGSVGTIVATDLAPRGYSNIGLHLISRDLTIEITPTRSRVCRPGRVEEVVATGNAYQAEDRAFVQAVAGGDRTRIRSDYADGARTLELTLAAATAMIAGVRFDRERLCAAAADELIAATDVADLLVRLGVPFREAHGVVAGLVRTVLADGRSLSQLGDKELAAHSRTLADHGEEFRAVLTQSSWLESKASQGGTAAARVREQLKAARSTLDEGAPA
jgi:hypothetical protein